MPLGAWAKDKKYKRVGRIAGETATTGFESYGLAAVSSGSSWFIVLSKLTVDHSWLRAVLHPMKPRKFAMLLGILLAVGRNTGITLCKFSRQFPGVIVDPDRYLGHL